MGLLPVRSSRRTLGTGLLAVLAATGCRSAPPEMPPGGRTPVVRVSPDTVRRGYTQADVRFMQRMIPHHAQALAMTALVPGRSHRRDIRLLAERIEASQHDEIAFMRRWLADRGEEVPPLDAHHGEHEAGDRRATMPGMLTTEEMAKLAGATGGDFDRLFIQLMIRHHEGALAMAAELFSAPGAAQEPEIFRFASDVDADQRAEIRRLRALQDDSTSRGPPGSRAPMRQTPPRPSTLQRDPT